MLEPDIAATILIVTSIFDSMDVTYAIGGSLASASYGRFRNTNDADIVADLQLFQVDELVDLLGDDFYRDAEMIRTAILQQRSFNLIFLPTFFKIDVFIPQNRPFDALQLERRIASRLPGMEQEVFLVSAEDSILAKLHWYRLGGEQSERQWRDVLTVIRAQRNRLDYDYLKSVSGSLQVSDLLIIAIEEVEKAL